VGFFVLYRELEWAEVVQMCSQGVYVVLSEKYQAIRAHADIAHCVIMPKRAYVDCTFSE